MRFDRLTKVVSPENHETLYEYYANGLLRKKTDPKGQHIEYAYDHLGRLVNEKYEGETKIAYDYKADDVVTQSLREVTNSWFDPQRVNQYAYDTSFRQTGETFGEKSLQEDIAYTYPPYPQTPAQFTSDLLKSYEVNSGDPVSYVYYEDGSVKCIVEGTNPLTDPKTLYDYFLDSSRKRRVNSNGARTRYKYDNQRRLIKVTNRKSLHGEILSFFQYDYDHNHAQTPENVWKGYRTKMTDNLGNTMKYYYDELYRLTQVDTHIVSPSEALRDTFQYDDIGNMTQRAKFDISDPDHPIEIGSPIVYTYVQNGQSKNSALLDSDGTFTYEWDFNGNLASKRDSGQHVTSYSWSDNDMLTGVRGPAIEVTYGYDYLGRRNYELVPATTRTEWLYMSEDVVRKSVYNMSDLLQYSRNFLHGPGIDEPLRKKDGAEILADELYFSDGLGSVTERIDINKTLKARYRYDAWGNLTEGNFDVDEYWYTGREFSKDSLYYYRARLYNPSLGRFTSQDPMRSSGNPYVYVGNNPVNFVDPFGLQGYEADPLFLDPWPWTYRMYSKQPHSDKDENILAFWRDWTFPWNTYRKAIQIEKEEYPGYIDPFQGDFRHCVAGCLLFRNSSPFIAIIGLLWWDCGETDPLDSGAGWKGFVQGAKFWRSCREACKKKLVRPIGAKRRPR